MNRSKSAFHKMMCYTWPFAVPSGTCYKNGYPFVHFRKTALMPEFAPLLRKEDLEQKKTHNCRAQQQKKKKKYGEFPPPPHGRPLLHGSKTVTSARNTL